jgi:hypothetical protein
MNRRKRRWRIEISEHDRMMLILKLERLTPMERSPNEKALLEFLESLPKRAQNLSNGAVIKKPPRKGRKLARGSENKRKTAWVAAREMEAYQRRVAAAERKKARMARKKKAEKKTKKEVTPKKPAPKKKATSTRRKK